MLRLSNAANKNVSQRVRIIVMGTIRENALLRSQVSYVHLQAPTPCFAAAKSRGSFLPLLKGARSRTFRGSGIRSAAWVTYLDPA